jgi:hypothetical protein
MSHAALGSLHVCGTRFRSLYDVSSLVPLAVEVAQHVHPSEPRLLTRPEFNANRVTVLEVGLDPAQCVHQTSSPSFGAEDFSWSKDEAVACL